MERRTVIGTVSLAGIAGIGTWAYKTAPLFWQRFAEDVQRDVLPAPARPDFSRWNGSGIHAAWLGHATVLLRVDGVTILTDPVFSTRVGLSLGPLTLGLKRLVEPALDLKGLPKIDLVLLSHAHMDHFDVPTLRALESRDTAIVTAHRTSDLLRPDRWKSVTELTWGGRAQAGPVEVRAFEVKHWGARMRTDVFRGYNGYTLSAGRYRILFGGDTAGTHLFRNVRQAKPFDLAIMPVGAYNPWIRYHCDPEQAWQMAQDARSEFFLPVHHQTFQLSNEPYTEPIERVLAAAGSNPDRVVARQIGEQWSMA